MNANQGCLIHQKASKCSTKLLRNAPVGAYRRHDMAGKKSIYASCYSIERGGDTTIRLHGATDLCFLNF